MKRKSDIGFVKVDKRYFALSPACLKVFKAFRPTDFRLTYAQLSKRTKLTIPTLYTLVRKLKKHGILVTRYEAIKPGSVVDFATYVSKSGHAYLIDTHLIT